MNESRFSRIDRECPAFFVDAWEAANPEDRAEMITFILGLPLDYPALTLVGNDRRSELLAVARGIQTLAQNWENLSEEPDHFARLLRAVGQDAETALAAAESPVTDG